jgi:thiamine-phosphate pyrophosphorylase
MNPVDLRLYAIIGPDDARGRDMIEAVRRAVAGGATLVQYRDKTGEGRALVERARALKAALAGTGVPLLVNDRVDVAMAAGADGVHLGQEDIHPADVRALLGERAIIGLTIKNAAQAREAQGLPVDYGCVGGVFATTSKLNKDAPVGLDGLAGIIAEGRRAGPLPLGAIAGIHAGNAAEVIGAGAEGIAVISAIFAQPDIEEAARGLRAIVDGALIRRGGGA